MSRAAILGDIRRALGRTAGQEAEAPLARIRVPEVSKVQRIDSMLRRVRALAGDPVHVSNGDEARIHVERLIAGKTAIASNSPVLREYGIDALPGVTAGVTDLEQLRVHCAVADFGITSADFALSDTGSLVMIASREEARLISLLPPVHIAVVPAERLLSGLDELFTLIPQPADQTSSMVLITGPSRTADIEQILVRGVHGPGTVHVIIVD